MKKRNKVYKKILGLSIGMILTGCMVGCSPVFEFTGYIHEAGKALPEDVTEYVSFENDKYAETAVIELENVDINKTGTYEVKMVIKNKEYPFNIEVVDTAAPVVTLKETNLEIENGTELFASDLVKKIEDVSETTVKFITGDDKETKESVILDKEGEQELIILVTDEHGNETEINQQINVFIPDVTAPVLSGVKNISVYVGTTPAYLEGVIAKDDFDGDLTEQIQVDSSEADVSKAGEYNIIYSCKDSSGNEVIETVKLTVKKKVVKKEQQTTQTQQTTPFQQVTPQQLAPQQQQQPQAPQQQTPQQQAPQQQKQQAPAPQPEPAPQQKPSAQENNNSEGESNRPPDKIDPSQFAPNLSNEELDEIIGNM